MEELLKERFGMGDAAAYEKAEAIRASMYPAFEWSALGADLKVHVVRAYLACPYTDAVPVPYGFAVSEGDQKLVKRLVMRGILKGLGHAAAADLRTATTIELDGFLRRTTLTEGGMRSANSRGTNPVPLDSLETAVVYWYSSGMRNRRAELVASMVGREHAALGAALPAELAQRILCAAFGVELPPLH